MYDSIRLYMKLYRASGSPTRLRISCGCRKKMDVEFVYIDISSFKLNLAIRIYSSHILPVSVDMYCGPADIAQPDHCRPCDAVVGHPRYARENMFAVIIQIRKSVAFSSFKMFCTPNPSRSPMNRGGTLIRTASILSRSVTPQKNKTVFNCMPSVITYVYISADDCNIKINYCVIMRCLYHKNG